MSQHISKENFIEVMYDVFNKFHKQLAVLTCSGADDLRHLTIGWGLMVNVWGTPNRCFGEVIE